MIIEIKYSKTYSLIYDIIGIGRLVHNDDGFLDYMSEYSFYNNDIEYYKSLISKVVDPNKNISAVFYQYKDQSVAKTIFRDIQFKDDIIKTELIENFYNIFSDIDYILSVVNQIYFPEMTLNKVSIPTKSELYNKFLIMPITKDVENSLYLLFESPYDFCKILIDELKKYNKILNKIYTTNNSEITEFISEFKTLRFESYNKYINGNIKNFNMIKIGFIFTNLNLVRYNNHIKDTFVLFLGKNSYKFIDKNYAPKFDIIKFKQLLSDETRINILRMLKEKDMYGNEIANNINIKRNTIMYQLDLLTRENVLNFYIKNKNIYYKINNDYFKEADGYIKEFV